MSSHKLFKKSFNAGKCKTSMKLAMSRMKLLRNKRQEQLKVMKRNLAQILQSGQEQTARARVEHVYREENTIAAYDLLESFGEQIIARLQIIESQKKCPLDLEEPISSILFASQRCAEIQELTDVRHHFSSKYGKEFVSAAVELRAGCRVNRSVIEKLSAKTPDGQTKLKMLAAIAKEHHVDWNPDVVEEQVSGLPETKLAGPTEFITATKFTEFPDVPKHNPGTKFVDHDTNIRPPEHPTSQINSEKPRPPGPGTSNANAAPDYQPRAPANVAADASVDIKYKHEDLLLEKSHWHRHFKDATTAAKAAAESAEKASIAARAAAELSSLEKMSRQNSIESRESERGNIPVELPHSQLNKTLHHEGLTNKNECPPKSFHATDGTFQGEVKDNGEEKPGTGYDHRNLKATRSKSGSSRSKFSSHDNELLASGAQWTENPCPSSPQQKETVNIKRQSYENVSDDLSEDGSVKKRLNPSHFRDSTYCDFKTETVTESFGGPEVAIMQRTEVHSPRSPPESETLIMKRLPSQGDKFGSHGEGNVSKSTFTGSKTEVDPVIVSTENHHLPLSSTSGEGIFSRGDTAKPASTHDSGAIFDDSGSESESCLDLGDAVVESKLHGLVPVARSSNSVPSTLHPRTSREPGNESLKKDGYTVPSRSTSDMQYTSSSSERNVKATEPSPYHDPVRPAFDDSDSFEASSEEEANGGSPILRNVSSSRGSPPSHHINHGPVEFASYSGNKVREQKKKQPPVLHDSDSDDSFDGNTVSVSGNSPGGNSPVRSSISTVKDQKRMNSLEPYSMRVTTATFYTDTGGPEPSVDSDTDSSNVLKFDRLGGLRNKGRIRPPYISDPSRISSSNANNLTSEESSLSYTPQASHTGKISLNLRENEESSKSKGSFELQKKKSKSSGHYFDDTDSDSDDPVDPGASIIQGVGRGTRTTLSSDFQEQRRFSGSKTEILASVESGVSGKRRSPEKTPILPDEELTKLVDQGARGSGRTNVVPVASVRTAGRSARSSQPTTHRNPMVVDESDTTSSLNWSFSESRHGRPVRGTHVEEEPRPITKTQKMETKTPRRSYDYIDSDSDEPIDTGSLLQQNLVSRRGKASPSYVKPARESPPQARQVGRPEIIKVDNSAPNRSLPVSHVEDQPKHTSKTVASRSLKDIKGSEVANKGLKPSEPRRTLPENKEMKTSRTSYHDYIDSDSDEPIDTGSLLQQNLVSRRGKASPSYMKPARESPPQATQVGRPEIIKVDSAPIHSLPVSYVEDQPKHTSKTVASRSPKDVKDSEVANKGLRPSEPRRTLENKEMKTSRTSYHGFSSDSDESTKTREHVGIKKVHKNSKDDSLQRTALQDNPPYQPSGAGSKFRAKVEVPDSKVSSTSLQNQPPETHRESQKQTKAAASDTSRADVKPSGSSVPTTSRENSFQRASHVHPKLPEYDSLLKMFQDARREK